MKRLFILFILAAFLLGTVSAGNALDNVMGTYTGTGRCALVSAKAGTHYYDITNITLKIIEQADLGPIIDGNIIFTVKTIGSSGTIPITGFLIPKSGSIDVHFYGGQTLAGKASLYFDQGTITTKLDGHWHLFFGKETPTILIPSHTAGFSLTKQP